MKRYPAYKDSGIEWIGEIPEHWEVKNLKYFAKIVNGSTPKSGKGEYWGGEIVWVTPNDLGKLKGNQITDSLKKITQRGLNNCGTTLTPKNSIILSTRAPIGHIGITDILTCTNQGCKTIVHDSSKCDNKFLFYYLFSSKNTLQSLGQGSTFIELSSQNLKDFQNPVPLFHEQQSIANYLDRKTRQIDTLIENKQKLIDLLKEQRAAIINHAVTKGRNPAVKLKNSGIEWLGEIPSSWKIVKYRRFVNFKNGINFSSGEKGDGVLTADVLNMYGKSIFINTANFYRVNKDIDKNHLLQKNDFLFVRSSLKKEGVGWMAIFDGFTEPVTFCGFLIRARIIDEKMNPIYLGYFFRSHIGRNDIISKSNTVTITNVGQESLGNVLIPIPPLLEQKQIAEYLDRKTKKIDGTIEKYNKSIELLKEYRTALISEVVTGKIDVRDSGMQEGRDS